MTTIVQKADPVLRKKAQEVAKEEFGTPKIKKIIADMKKALAGESDGVAIAAPQIGASVRIFAISEKLGELVGEASGTAKKDMKYVYINPVIIKRSKEKEYMEEGCLSVRYLYGKVKRPKKVVIRAQDEHGNTFEIGGSKVLAQIFQHETDHLEGKLFIDTAIDVHDLPPESLNS